MRDELVITGMGAVTPLGCGVETYWDHLVRGDCGITELTEPELQDLPVHRAARVRDFQPRDYMPKPLMLDMAPFARYAYAAAAQALEQSGLDPSARRVGLVMGTALQGLDYLAQVQHALDAEGRGGDPKLMTKYMGNIAAAQFAIRHGIQGPSLTVGTACSSGGDAVTTAALLLQGGMAEAAVVMAGEAAICPAAILSLTKSGALSPAGESRPFSADRSGFVLGEGGGALVLETAESAERRGAPVLARLLGWGSNNDAFHPVCPHPEGTQAAACMEEALQRAGLSPSQVDYVNAHGTATLKGDLAEAVALHRVFGEKTPPVSSTKGATGHMMGAGGITELIACVKALETGLLPPNLGLSEQDPACGLDLAAPAAREGRYRVAMSNAFGFGGQNSCLLVGSP